MAWKKTKHAKEAFESLPAKYRQIAQCINCHSDRLRRGYRLQGHRHDSQPGGHHLRGVSRPGKQARRHRQEVRQQEALEPDEEKEVRGSIYKVQPQNVCMRCHISQTHEEHPKYDKQ